MMLSITRARSVLVLLGLISIYLLLSRKEKNLNSDEFVCPSLYLESLRLQERSLAA